MLTPNQKAQELLNDISRIIDTPDSIYFEVYTNECKALAHLVADHLISYSKDLHEGEPEEYLLQMKTEIDTF